MARFTDFQPSIPEVKNIMERFLDRFPDMFDGFNPDGIHVVLTEKKKSQEPMKLRNVTYPMEIFVGKPYVLEVFGVWWEDMNDKQKNLAVFHIMCMIPEGAFDESSDTWAKKRKPEINMFMLEFAACGGVADPFNNPAAKDPMERNTADLIKEVPGMFSGELDEDAIPATSLGSSMDGIKRVPVTPHDIANNGLEEKVAVSA